MSLFSGLKERLRDGLKRSQEYLSTGLATVLEPDRPIDDTLYDELEELLIAADLGAAIAADFTNRSTSTRGRASCSCSASTARGRRPPPPSSPPP